MHSGESANAIIGYTTLEAIMLTITTNNMEHSIFNYDRSNT